MLGWQLLGCPTLSLCHLCQLCLSQSLRVHSKNHACDGRRSQLSRRLLSAPTKTCLFFFGLIGGNEVSSYKKSAIRFNFAICHLRYNFWVGFLCLFLLCCMNVCFCRIFLIVLLSFMCGCNDTKHLCPVIIVFGIIGVYNVLICFENFRFLIQGAALVSVW